MGRRWIPADVQETQHRCVYYACPHCNNLKKEARYDDKIIDCCVDDPEEKLEQSYEKGHVRVHNIVDDDCRTYEINSLDESWGIKEGENKDGKE